MGCPTINNGLLHSIGGLLEMIKGLKFKNKKASLWKLWLEWGISQTGNRKAEGGRIRSYK